MLATLPRTGVVCGEGGLERGEWEGMGERVRVREGAGGQARVWDAAGQMRMRAR